MDTTTEDLGPLDPEELAEALEAVTALRQRRADEERKAAAELERRKAIEALTVDGELVVHVASQNSDLTEGRGWCRPRGYFLFEEDARKANYVLEGVMGSRNDCSVTQQKIFTSFEEWASQTAAIINNGRMAEVRTGERP